MKKLAIITASLALLATPVLAQTAVAPATSTTTTTTSTTIAEAKYSTIAKDEMFSSKLKGLNITNQADATVGEIMDIAFKNDKIDAFILSVGGFLGMGEHYVAVSPASVNVHLDPKTSKWVAKMNTTKEALKAAPQFVYPK
jgi:hypothetical protein